MKKGSSDRYFQGSVNEANKLVPEGIEGRVAYKGAAADIVFQMLGGIRSEWAMLVLQICKNFTIMLSLLR